MDDHEQQQLSFWYLILKRMDQTCIYMVSSSPSSSSSSVHHDQEINRLCHARTIKLLSQPGRVAQQISEIIPFVCVRTIPSELLPPVLISGMLISFIRDRRWRRLLWSVRLIYILQSDRPRESDRIPVNCLLLLPGWLFKWTTDQPYPLTDCPGVTITMNDADALHSSKPAAGYATTETIWRGRLLSNVSLIGTAIMRCYTKGVAFVLVGRSHSLWSSGTQRGEIFTLLRSHCPARWFDWTTTPFRERTVGSAVVLWERMAIATAHGGPVLSSSSRSGCECAINCPASNCLTKWLTLLL